MWLGTPLGMDGDISLRDPTADLSESVEFEPAAPLSIRLRGLNVTTRHDIDLPYIDGNDLIVVTKTRFGSEPPVRRLHDLRREVEPGWKSDFLYDVLLSVRDFSDKRLTVEVQVYDVDGVPEWLVDRVGELAPLTEIVLPVLAPAADLPNMSGEKLLQLVDNVADHDPIIDQQITLEKDARDDRQPQLQPCYLVCFGDSGPDEECVLETDRRVYTADGTPYDGDYAVLELEREQYETRERELGHKAAKLMTELNGKGQSDEKAAVDFLMETMASYENYSKLKRAKELQAKDDRTQAEQNLLEDLQSNDEIDRLL
jgi:hypothetical protein